MNGARFDPGDILLEAMLQLAPIVESIAQDIVDEVQKLAPRDTGEYADSWEAGRARLDVGGKSVSAVAGPVKNAKRNAGLGAILEFGAELKDGTMLPPQPHARPAAARVQAKLATGA